MSPVPNVGISVAPLLREGRGLKRRRRRRRLKGQRVAPLLREGRGLKLELSDADTENLL